MFVEYWNFISRELPINPFPTALDIITDFYYKTVLWSLFFCILHIITPLLLRNIFPSWFSSLSTRDKRDIGSYVVCTVHHLAMVPTAWVHIYNDSLLSPEIATSVQYAVVESSVAPFVIGYLVGDTLCYAVQEMFALRFEFMIHHVLTLALIYSALAGPGYFCRFIPHLIICDTTNIFFNFAWLLRRSGFKGTSVVTLLEVFFAFSFLLVRAINLPVVFLQTMFHPEVAQWGWARYTLAPIALMQWYWFSKILTSMVRKLMPESAKKRKQVDQSASKAKRI